jgi:hypothetical protein
LTARIFAGLAGRKAHRKQKYTHKPEGTAGNRHKLKKGRGSVLGLVVHVQIGR